MDGLLGVLVTAVVTQPDVEAKFNEGESKRTLGACETNPDLGVHEQAMVEDLRFRRGVKSGGKSTGRGGAGNIKKTPKVAGSDSCQFQKFCLSPSLG